LKTGFALFAIAWSLISMAHGLAHSWPRAGVVARPARTRGGSANPAGMKATAEWFSGPGTRAGGRLFNIGASVGSMLAPPLVVWAILSYSLAGGVCDHRRTRVRLVALWWRFYQSPEKHPALSEPERILITSGQESHLRGDGTRPAIGAILRQRNFWGIACPFPGRPAWGTLTFWLPLYLNTVRHFDLKQIALFCLDAVSRR